MTARLARAVIGAVLLASIFPTTAVASVADPTIEDNIVIESFDGEPIVATLMLPEGASKAAPVPAVLRTHGWGGRRETAPAEGSTTERLLDEGYAVLTWDSRGFGESGGEANVGSPDFEVKDAMALIAYLSKRKEILQDGPGDPRVGWTGGSNAAGVQFNTAALDKARKIDAIVPEISWGYLPQDLMPNRVAKQGWDELLYAVGIAGGAPEGLGSPAGPQTGVYAQEIHEGHAQITTTGDITKDIEKWFAHKSTTIRSKAIRTPTLIIQGTVDTLFPLQDAFDNYRNLKKAGTPVKLIAYCAGHTLGCSYPGGASGYPKGADGKRPIWEDRVIAWLDRYVKGKRVATGPEVEWQAQDGRYYAASRYPLPGVGFAPGKLVATGQLVGPGFTGGDGALDGNPAPAWEIGTRTAVREPVFGPAAFPTPILGVPKVTITGSVVGQQAFAFFELVDVAEDGTRVTVDDQVMPLRLKGGEIKKNFDLNGIAWLLQPGHTLELEITTGSAQYQIPRTGPYVIDLKAVTRIPVVGARIGVKA